jgi:hypothetical protein
MAGAAANVTTSTKRSEVADTRTGAATTCKRKLRSVGRTRGLVVSLGPLADAPEVAAGRARLPAGAPLLGRARGLHRDVDVARATRGGLVVDRALGGAGLAAKVAFQPLGRLELARLVLLLQLLTRRAGAARRV